MEHCSNEVPAECADVVPYTTYPNKLLMLNGTEQYTQFSDNITAALMNCTGLDEYWTRWGVCNIMFPRCLLGFELQLCQETCFGDKLACFTEEINSSRTMFMLTPYRVAVDEMKSLNSCLP